jgi:dTDP-4-amino-4,6-dideoxygalactose transaminase
LILRALGIGPGDEVLVPAHTFIATWLAVTHAGAKPVPVDVDPETGNLAPERLAAAIGRRTRAVIPVHLYGQPASMAEILAIATQHGLRVIEDAAQAHGARFHGRKVGTFGAAAAFSFYPVKNLGAFGDGGAVVTQDGSLADRVRRLRNYGSSHKYAHSEIGVNSRLDELQAAFLRIALHHLDEWNDARRRIARRYREVLHSSPACRALRVSPDVEPVWHLFVIRCNDRQFTQSKLRNRQIECMVHYPVPPHLQEAYRHLGWTEGQFPEAEGMSRDCLSLPIGPHLSEEQVSRVIDAILA